ncbi:FAD/NAD(P)-binding oxidoreductase [Reichenbachiella sp. MALMAid0571]|uniref:NAD(P)/FAD-dependent oxidoreductase n=1 Tax=Reichenbachiella sp. MALMAid0571 TaxID=3143939 RepID=UPI0032DF908C
MAKVVILGAGVSGHTAALTLRRKLSNKHEVVVVSPNSKYQWMPSNIWVGIGRMKSKQVTFSLAPVYKRKRISFHQAKAVSIHPEGNIKEAKPYVTIDYTDPEKQGVQETITYDYLVNATGPKLNFEATEGLSPEVGHCNSVCTFGHAENTWNNLQAVIKKMEAGQKQTLVVGTGHAMATCQGAAFEYVLNIAFEIKKRNLEEQAELIWITNEYEVGDFGMGGAYVQRNGYITSTTVFAESILAEYGIRWIKRAGVQKLDGKKIYYENLDGESLELPYDFSMLIPSFSGVGLKTYDKNGLDITDTVFAANGFMKVDADYTAKPYEEWDAEDWPSVYQNPTYDNMYAAGIAFAPPHAISKPMKSKTGKMISPTPPRTGMPSGVIGKVVALNIAEKIKKGISTNNHRASMAKMGAACVVSAGFGMTKGMAATMTVFPIVQDWKKYPRWGRNLSYTVGEAGLAGHWIKVMLHYLFLYKAKARPFWWLIPE